MVDIAYPIKTRTLANGLRVVVSPDHTVPMVTVNLWVDVGSRHEVPGRTGFAHLFEHLMFQGSRNVTSGEHFEALMAEGGRLNATTWFDRTNYFETLPVEAFELALWLEADRHGHLLDAVTQENLDNQRDVVKEEKRQRYDNVPYGNALIDVYATLFPEGHPYHHPTIGSMDDLDAATLDDVHTFFRTHYGPNNTVLTVVGDVDPPRAFEAVERYFGELPAITLPPAREPQVLEPLTEPVRLERHSDVPNDRLYLAFRLPVEGAPDFDAAELAVDILAGLSTSRLVERLVRAEQSATGVDASAWGFVDGVSLGLFTVDIAADHDAAAVEAAFCAELDRFAVEGPTDVELETAKAQAERWWLSTLASQEQRADLISRYTLHGDDPAYVCTYLAKVAAVTGEQVRAAAAAYLTAQRRATVAYLTSDEESDV